MTQLENNLLIIAGNVEAPGYPPIDIIRMLEGFFPFPWNTQSQYAYNDWREFISNELRNLWNNLSLEGKLIAYLIAAPMADAKESFNVD